jgi:hypothetical protein
MGGSSVSTFANTKGVGVFNGTCAIVKFLHAPGFAKIATGSYYKTNTFNDASAAVHGTIDLMVRSSTPTYKGFRLGWAAKNVPRTSAHGGGSFKAGFLLADSADWQTVKIPMKDFSYDWSGFTGRCDTKVRSERKRGERERERERRGRRGREREGGSQTCAGSSSTSRVPIH